MKFPVIGKKNSFIYLYIFKYPFRFLLLLFFGVSGGSHEENVLQKQCLLFDDNAVSKQCLPRPTICQQQAYTIF